jgi:hypothetical protein
MIGTGHGRGHNADEPNQGEVFRGLRWMLFDEVLGDTSIELVAVEALPGRNLEYAKKCVRAGKFVHLDKPPGADLPALRAMLDEAAEGAFVRGATGATPRAAGAGVRTRLPGDGAYHP